MGIYMIKIISILLAFCMCAGSFFFTVPNGGISDETNRSAIEEPVKAEKKTIGILGGMGPLATTDLMRKIIAVTDAKSDNEHVRVYVDSNTSIPDRTEAILHGGADPVPEMLSALRHLEACGADCILVSCNTAHYFLPQLQSNTDIPILNMPAITAKRCAELYPGKTAAILATTGTLDVGIYNKALAREGVEFLVPDDSEREEIMRFIYDVVKASKPIQPEDAAWSRLLQGLRERGADYFILGCTELPILAEGLNDPGPFVDPTEELAREAVLFCGYPVIGD
jgi:aspartate racemase